MSKYLSLEEKLEIFTLLHSLDGEGEVLRNGYSVAIKGKGVIAKVPSGKGWQFPVKDIPWMEESLENQLSYIN